MLLEEFLPDSASVKSDKSGEKPKEILKSDDSNDNLKNKFSDSDDEANKDSSDGEDMSTDERSHCDENNCQFSGMNRNAKIVLPLELEELVKEALAELKPADWIY